MTRAKGVRDYDEIAALFAEHVVGRPIAELLVFGMNALKAVSPPLASLAGRTVVGTDQGAATRFSIFTDSIAIDVDLQRVGVVAWLPDLRPWAYGAGAMPTGQLLLESGGGVTFAEPNKTKRITFTPRTL